MTPILVVAPSWVGDAVMVQPLLARLKARLPDARIDVLAAPWARAVFNRMPEVTEVIDSPFVHGELRLAARWRLARALASRGYARAYVLPNSWKSALIPWLAGIPQRTGFVGEFRYGLLNDARRLDAAAYPRMVDASRCSPKRRAIRSSGRCPRHACAWTPLHATPHSPHLASPSIARSSHCAPEPSTAPRSAGRRSISAPSRAPCTDADTRCG